jgi:dTDP-4-dehydrorhamnose reductase
MLGRMVADVLGQNPELNVTSAARRPSGGNVISFDAEHDSVEPLIVDGRHEWIINAVGVIEPRIDESDPASVARAIAVNAAFPHRLAAAARQQRARVIQIATDGVFSGSSAPYDEAARHDADGVYARSKSLGEVRASNVVELRCSVIGPEDPPARSLLGWALSQPPGGRIPGYTNHRWNGLTTLSFAKLCEGVILERGLNLPSPLHVVPGDAVTKAELLRLAVSAFGRDDVTVGDEPAPVAVDRTLATRHPEANRRLWSAAGYSEAPRIAAMVAELASLRT